ncbi:MAG: hypothetical protein J6W29_00770 [Neisseriaceae bacterium]|nr:hypothetical protein [Neisseriaceae bacterium]
MMKIIAIYVAFFVWLVLVYHWRIKPNKKKILRSILIWTAAIVGVVAAFAALITALIYFEVAETETIIFNIAVWAVTSAAVCKVSVDLFKPVVNDIRKWLRDSKENHHKKDDD